MGQNEFSNDECGMSGGWCCAAVVIRAVERQNKKNGKMTYNK
jgi:hypothetical protein